ncbi:MAG: chemotaxis response regulator protein-glutamate methylesterase [Gammaproteobacteria bacterium]|nr:chemotaxis response regulator protein-glutamate methylesterase [Gammaproteobacteria bacterium]
MRIAIVNDTQMAVEVLKKIIFSFDKHQIAWVAVNGKEAVEKCAKDVPDLILMDVIMPIMNGVEATRAIMQATPCSILMVTSTVDGNASQVFEAMGAGALDATNTPVIEGAGSEEGARLFIDKINTLEKLISSNKRIEISNSVGHQVSTNSNYILAIGASTGGPSALAKVLSSLPTDFPAPIVIAQHVDKMFSENFALWLGDQTALPVRIAKAGDKLEMGTVLVAGTGDNMMLDSQSRIQYTIEPEHYPYRPSVNVLFESIAKNWSGHALGVLLTGMGDDGANGLLRMKERDWLTIAQDANTCAVYGMPKAAAKLNAATEILPLDQIGTMITSIINSGSKKAAS